jgi:hypothetical protein
MTMAPQIMIPAPAVSSVILTAAGHYRCEWPGPDQIFPEHLGLRTIEVALRSAGFGRTRIVAPEGVRPPDLREDARSIVARFRGAGAGEPGAVIGISTSSEEYPTFRSLSLMLKEAFPAASIVAGGAHFARQHLEGVPDVVEAALIDGLADAIQVGHAGAFIAMIVEHGGSFRDVEAPGLYHLAPHTGRVIGHGRGSYPRVDWLPMVGEPADGDAHTMLADQCLNGCDFCFLSGKRPPRIPPHVAEAGLRSALGDGLKRLFLCDSNPLAAEQRGFYSELFERVADCGQVLKAVYLDPAELVRGLDDVVHAARLHDYWNFFAGRDAVVEAQARIVGTKYRGRLKDQMMLDAEGHALRTFISIMRGMRFKSRANAPQQLKLSYIVTPFETRESALALYDDMQEFRSRSDDSMRVNVAVQTLMPYPGTAVRRRLKDAIDLGDFTFGVDRSGRLAPWKKDVGPGLAFMCAMHGLPQRGGDDLFLEGFLQAIHDHFPRRRFS